MPRFVILRHEFPANHPRTSHWDLMLETGNGLRTWALEVLPAEWHQRPAIPPNDTAAETGSPAALFAIQLGDHRLDYLTYEGPISGDRGSVRRVESGAYAPLAQSPDRWEVQLTGQSFSGRLRLSRTADDPQLWRIEWSHG